MNMLSKIASEITKPLLIREYRITKAQITVTKNELIPRFREKVQANSNDLKSKAFLEYHEGTIKNLEEKKEDLHYRLHKLGVNED